jgi:hypothetical protein
MIRNPRWMAMTFILSPPPPPWDTAATTASAPPFSTQNGSNANDDPCWFFELPRLTKTLPPLPDGMSGRGVFGRGGVDVGGVPIEAWNAFWTEVMVVAEREKRCSRLLSLFPIVVCLLVVIALPVEWAHGVWAFVAVPVAMVVSCLVGVSYNACQNEKFIEYCQQQDEVFRGYGFSLAIEAVKTDAPTTHTSNNEDDSSSIYVTFLAFRPVQSATDHV